MEPNVVQLISEASNLLSTLQLALMNANNSAVKAVKEVSTNLLPTTAGLAKAISLIVLAGKMEGELQALKNAPASVAGPSEERQGSVLEAITELEERREKSKNVLFMNIAESAGTTRVDNIKDDHSAVMDILKNFDSISVENIRVSRIGRERTDKVRPVKVSLANSEDARHILRNTRLLKNGVKVKADLTISQREQLRNLWCEVEERRATGEENLTVKYFDAVPKIIKLTKNFPRISTQRPIIRTSEE
jgi:hypothetical protein